MTNTPDPCSSIVEFTACNTARYMKPLYTNNNHDAYLYHGWNNNKRKNTGTPKLIPIGNSTKRTTTAYSPNKTPVKDDPSVTPTLETLCIFNTRSLHSTYIDTDIILSITIWNQPIVQYQLPLGTNSRNQSR